MVTEQYNYAAINEQINKKSNLFDFMDLRAARVKSAYDEKASPTDNIKRFLAENFYPEKGKEKIAEKHAFDVFHAIHEQCLARKMAGGFNDFAENLRGDCASMEITDGVIRFVGPEGKLMGEFDTASSRRTDLRERAIEERHGNERQAVKIFTKESLHTLLPEYTAVPSRPPVLVPNTFRISPAAFESSNTAPSLLDEEKAGETVCAAYVTEFLRYYIGSPEVKKLGIENQDAWELKKALLASSSATVDASLSKFLRVKDGRVEFAFAVMKNGRSVRLHGLAAKSTPYYGLVYRKFYRAAEAEKFPPGLITLYYHNTQQNRNVIQGNKKRGLKSLNSHVVVNLGEGRLRFDSGKFTPSQQEKSVEEVLLANIPGAKKELDWLFLDSNQDPAQHLSRVILNGEQLIYQNKKFLHPDGSPAVVRPNDVVDWQDILVADRFHGKNRLSGLSALMMTNNYELVDALGLKPETMPEVSRAPAQMPYPIDQIVYLKPGETLENTLKASGIPAADIRYHLYAYEKAGLDPRRLRPFDPVPVFHLADIKTEVANAHGLGSALASVRAERATEYMKLHPQEHFFVIQPKYTPVQLAADILALPAIKKLGALSGKERQFVLTAIFSAQKNLFVEVNTRGEVNAVHRYEIGEIVYAKDDLLEAVSRHIEQERKAVEVFVPSSLPGGRTLKPSEFTAEECALIESASPNAHVRRALALILVMEQKQTEGASRAALKSLAESIGLKKYRPRSLGLFQVRILPSDFATHGIAHENAEKFRTKVIENPQLNAELATQRVTETLARAEYFYAMHGEVFEPAKAGGMSYVLNCYHASEGKVLGNILNVWAQLVEEELKFAPVVGGKNTSTRFDAIGRILKRRGEITISDEEIENQAAFVTRDKAQFLRSPLLHAVEKWYASQTGEKLSLNIAPAMVDRPEISTTFLNYGIRATRYGALDEIESYSASRRQPPSGSIMLAEAK